MEKTYVFYNSDILEYLYIDAEDQITAQHKLEQEVIVPEDWVYMGLEN